jgi:acyl-CoA thioester hydrolase
MSRRGFRFLTTVAVRWRDLDALGHVNNAVYFTYLETARFRYLRHLALISDAPDEVGIIIAAANCQYKSPLKLGDQVTIHIRAEELRNSSFAFAYHLETPQRRLVAQAHTIQVCYDYAEQHPVRIPEDWRRAIQAYEPNL